MYKSSGMQKRLVAKYVAKRIVVYVLTMFIAFSVVFFFLRLIPGDPVLRYIQQVYERYAYRLPQTEEIIQEYRRTLGLDGDLFTQYIIYLRRVFLEFNLGPSFLDFPKPAQDLILRHLPWSIGLLAFSTLLAWLIGLVLGTLAGWRRDSKMGMFLYILSLSISQVPYYLLALVFVLVFAYLFPVFPARFAYSPTLTPSLNLEFISSIVYHAILPSLSFIAVATFGWLISTRAITITILGEDFLLFAQAKGLGRLRILNRYVLRNILLPQVTGLAMSLGFVVNGFFLIEWISAYPGIGTLLGLAIGQLDYNTFQGIILISIFAVLTANLVIELLYPLVDPRVRTGG